jgi:TrmH family RNA methyltransferase
LRLERQQKLLLSKRKKINFYCATLQNSTAYHTQDYTTPNRISCGYGSNWFDQEWRDAATQNIIILMQKSIA